MMSECVWQARSGPSSDVGKLHVVDFACCSMLYNEHCITTSRPVVVKELSEAEPTSSTVFAVFWIVLAR